MKPAIHVENLAKRYTLGTNGGASYHTLREALTGLATAPWRRLRDWTAGGAAALDLLTDLGRSPRPRKAWHSSTNHRFVLRLYGVLREMAPAREIEQETILQYVRRRFHDLSLAMRYYRRRPYFVVLAGMHRSGTSCLARSLNLAGVELGSRPLLGPSRSNPHGHWESQDVVWFNDAILAFSDGSWIEPPATARWTRRHQWQARRILWDFHGCRVVAFKDPRITLTYPLWKQVLSEHALIACFRHPMNVALSLQARGNCSVEQGLRLWKLYNEALLSHAADHPRVFWFNFDGGADAVDSLLSSICKALALPGYEEAIRHYEVDLQHHCGENHVLPADVQQVYDALLGQFDHQKGAAPSGRPSSPQRVPGPSAVRADFAGRS
jgi:hypothetical protein